MSLHEFQVVLVPPPNSEMLQCFDLTSRNKISEHLQRTWPAIHIDENAGMKYMPNSSFLAYETQEFAFQIMIYTPLEVTSISISMRYAYCNPESVFTPFCSVACWLMEEYAMRMIVARSIDQLGDSPMHFEQVDNSADVPNTLLPIMKVLRDAWQQATGGHELKLYPEQVWSLLQK